MLDDSGREAAPHLKHLLGDHLPPGLGHAELRVGVEKHLDDRGGWRAHLQHLVRRTWGDHSQPTGLGAQVWKGRGRGGGLAPHYCLCDPTTLSPPGSGGDHRNTQQAWRSARSRRSRRPCGQRACPSSRRASLGGALCGLGSRTMLVPLGSCSGQRRGAGVEGSASGPGTASPAPHLHLLVCRDTGEEKLPCCGDPSRSGVSRYFHRPPRQRTPTWLFAHLKSVSVTKTRTLCFLKVNFFVTGKFEGTLNWTQR